ncbi:S-layer homology domain-containing protein [Fodinisporobacter ferrooxydans]|uniref:S-layer homology domain-containing protein n=1 Tax=Fodinisporobacter ferrooxydans TaxID=2901836 RepID=A0ABY4CQI3_9BACL|nr:S-layer homology domain-containing protein [Alicyclobacillaceae bacterium MYW30-H2]
MKKLLTSVSIALMAASVMSTSAFAAAINSINLQPVTVDSNNQVQVDGIISSQTADQITIKVMDSTGALDYINQKTSDANGSFSFEFPLKNPIQGATYQVTVGGTGVASPQTATFIYSPTTGGGDSGSGDETTTTITPNNPTVTLSNQPTTITVQPGLSQPATVDLSQLITASNGQEVATLPQVTATSSSSLGSIQLSIPSGTKITAPAGWDGKIELPTVVTGVSVSNANVNAAVEVGSPNVRLTFDHAVRLLLPGQAGKSAGYIINGVFTPITNVLSADNQAAGDALAYDSEGDISVGNDLAIWTKHFTEFVSYTNKTSSSSSSSGGGGSIQSNSAIISATNGGTVTLNGATIHVPPNAFASDINVTVNQITDTSGFTVPANSMLVSNVFDITKDKDGTFSSPVTITLPFDTSKVDTSKYNVGLYWYNDATGQWVELDNVTPDLANGKVSGTVQHFTKFAVLATAKNAPNQPQETFSDVKGNWAQPYIDKLVSLGAISGYPDGTFKPDQNITRAEFAEVLVKALNLKPQNGKVFSDTANHWAKDAIATAAYYGIVNGYNSATFGPDNPITREQMAVMMENALKLQATNNPIIYKDQASISSWAVSSIETLVENNVVSGYPDNTFKPQANATRAEAATMIVRALNK